MQSRPPVRSSVFFPPTLSSNEITYVVAGLVNVEDSDGTVISNNIFTGGDDGYFE